MAAGILSFTGLLAIKRNSDFNFTLTCVDSTTGNPVDFTGYAAKMSIGYYPPCNSCMVGCECHPSLTIIYTLSSTGMNPNITFNAVNGIINLFIPVATTNTFPLVTDGIYDLLLYPPDDNGGTETFIQGPVQVIDGVTTP